MTVEAPKQAVVTVNLRGNREIVEMLDEKAILTFVNLEGVKEPGKQELQVHVGGIPTAIHYELKPSVITVELLQKPQAAEESPQPKTAGENGGQSK
jgi:YbbR domain-containing protein